MEGGYIFPISNLCFDFIERELYHLKVSFFPLSRDSLLLLFFGTTQRTHKKLKTLGTLVFFLSYTAHAQKKLKTGRGNKKNLFG
jgi:hypothetical protein